jgi:hypothetical protein
MAQSIPAEVAASYRDRMAARLEHAGAGLERLFPGLAPGEGVAKLRHSFALTIGLWQMSAASACASAVDLAAVKRGRAAPSVFGWNYADELRRALRALWESVAAAAPAPAS